MLSAYKGRDLYYLDGAATTRPYMEVLNAVQEANERLWANPSTHYSLGFEARDMLENSRKNMAEIFHIDPQDLFFTSGGTESDNMAIKGLATYLVRTGKDRIVCCATEHPAVINACEAMGKYGCIIDYVGVDHLGAVNMDELKRALSNKKAGILCLMLANNETGFVYSRDQLKEIKALTEKNKTIWIADGVQYIGKVADSRLDNLGPDIITFSAHKFHGVRGAGGIYMPHDTIARCLLSGGGQENGRRSGTEATPLIIGMETALKKSYEDVPVMKKMAQNFFDGMFDILCTRSQPSSPDYFGARMRINGPSMIPGLVSLSFSGILGDTLQVLLDQENICVATGSACHSGSSDPSHVLTAMKVPKEFISGSIRISIEDITYTTKDGAFVGKKIAGAIKKITDSIAKE